jgi:galactokinase
MASSAQMITKISSVFREKFGEPDHIVRSPGRINLIGEHTDYNMGFVLPASIDKAIYIAVQKRNDNHIHLVAADLQETYECTTVDLQRSSLHWPDYILGVVDQLLKKGISLQGFNAVLAGDVPLGAGLSSSAAVECATAFALNTVFSLGLDRKTMVQLAQKAENEFAGVQCGIMDQFASMFGQEGKLIRLDCRSLDYVYLPFPSNDVDIVLLDTGVKHALASSEYNLRRQECEEGVRIISRSHPSIQSLRDASIQIVEECLSQGDPVVYNRCRYVVEEIHRLLAACHDLEKNNLAAFGHKMFDTHAGLSRLYEVSCPEADALVGMASAHKEILGARMMGGGFGGCTINLVQKGYAEKIISEMTPRYHDQFKRDLVSYTVAIDKGTSLV